VKYVSTRGRAPVLGFADALLTGLAPDGGLYLPESWPRLGAGDLAAWSDRRYQDIAVDVMAPFVDDSMDAAELGELVEQAYSSFDDPAVAPLRDLGDGRWMMELFHGPTLAFKDLPLQLVGRLFDRELTRRGERVTVIGATSGDTGSAAIEALRGSDAVDVFIFHPAGRVSEVQRRQMTTIDAPNIHNIALEGTFDDCQDMVKALFADDAQRDELRFSAVNSINWARLMAQVAYYVVAAARLADRGPALSFVVPTGNFGNVFSGWAARRMGVPVSQLVVATNRNDILARFFQTGTMRIDQVEPTISPSMDIQVSSNLERLLFELYGRDGEAVADLLTEFREAGTVSVPPDRLAAASEVLAAVRVDEPATRAAIKRYHEGHDLIVDPHTAVGLDVAERVRRDPAVPQITMATAHPAKFPDAVEAATGIRPPLPDRLADLFDRPEHYDTLPVDQAAVTAHLRAALAV
jgi:threonine synthase